MPLRYAFASLHSDSTSDIFLQLGNLPWLMSEFATANTANMIILSATQQTWLYVKALESGTHLSPDGHSSLLPHVA